MRTCVFIYLLTSWTLTFSARAQDSPTAPHSSSTMSGTNKYEIVQSHLAAKWTFRLDRFCGVVSQFVRTTSGNVTWEAMPIEKRPTCEMDGKIHYQLFSSSLAARHTFLMNTDTGTSWLLTTRLNRDQTESAVWELFEEGLVPRRGTLPMHARRSRNTPPARAALSQRARKDRQVAGYARVDSSNT